MKNLCLVLTLCILLVSQLSFSSFADTPNLATTIESLLPYGRSVEDRPLTAVVLGYGCNVTLILGGIHGNELSAPGFVELIKEYLEAHPDELIGNTVVLVSHVNPDGDAAHTRANADGVDLNRNFPTNWEPKRRGISLSPGSKPLSEPEASALVKLVAMVKPIKIVSVHQPFGCLLPSGPGGDALAAAMSDKDHYPVRDGVGYPTPGSFGSYCYRQLNIAAVTLELPQISAAHAWKQNQSAILAAIHLSPNQVAE